jgi:hypothetical protein
MKLMKMKFAAALVFSMGLGFAATDASARIAVDWKCMKECLGEGVGERLCTVYCDATFND